MIRLTHLTGEPFLLNAELIRYVEQRPETFITLTTGDRLIVRETVDDVLERAVAYQRSKFLLPAAPPPHFAVQPSPSRAAADERLAHRGTPAGSAP